MSGAMKSIGKTFKKVAMAPIKVAKKIDKAARNIVKKVWKIKILRYIIIAVAAYFTAGAAMAYFGAAGAAGGVAAAGASAGTAAAAGTAATVGTTAAAAAGTAAFSGAAVGAAGVTALEGVTVTATVGAASAVSAGAIAAASVGVAGGVALANAASDAAQGAMTNGNGTVTGAPGGMGTTANAGGTGNGMFGPVSGVDNFAGSATDLAPINVTADLPAVDTSTFGFDVGSAASAAGAIGPMAQNQVDVNLNKDGTKKTFFDKAKDLVTNPMSSQNNFAQYGPDGNVIGASPAANAALAGGTAAPAGGSLMGDFGKTMLLKSAVDFASAYLQKPPSNLANQYGGVNQQGEGFGQAMHTTNGGFGLAVGGPGQAPNSGVPDSLKLHGNYGTTGANGSAGAYAGSLSNAALAGKSPGAGNIGQTVANSAGVGGLIPQGAVDYMGGKS